MAQQPTILILGAFDTKGPEHAFLRQQLIELGCSVRSMNVGILGTTDLFPVEVEAEEVASAAGHQLEMLRSAGDRGDAIAAMGAGAATLLARLVQQQQIDGVIGMGGSGGTSVITTAMQALPLGVPKVCVSTVAGTDTGPYVGTKDITLVPAVVDVAGVNRISRLIYSRAAGAIHGMASVTPAASSTDRPIIAASMFGNTTECVDHCRELLEEAGYEVLVFHATGTGGRTMETLIDEGLVDAVLDITTTELADELCDGILSAGPGRLTAAGRQGIPQLIVPGCLDMVNFGAMATVPERFLDAGRSFYEWNPAVTLMRTTAGENSQLGTILAEKANAARGPVAFLLPTAGVSILDGEGELFCDRQADQALFDAIGNGLREDIAVEQLDVNINDPLFAQRAVAIMLELIAAATEPGNDR